MKNIILLSDGTGNGAAKKNKTNVWRLYEALDLHNPDQIAMYDDGVGSKDTTLNKVLGGAFGFGLKRNVIELYKFLCRNYQSKDKDNPAADNIYLFGFSRGAFTVRVLAGFVKYAGLCTGIDDEKELDRIAKSNFSHYRRKYNHGYLSRYWNKLFGSKSELQKGIEADIKFIGVWDTVDAYALPIDELAIIWDLLIYPIRFPDRELNDSVERACHAISIDDERHTFHPVLWNESGENSNKIQQLWFSGVHSDVGGGYPRKSQSLVTLDWMLTQVETDAGGDGLIFIDALRKQYKSQSDWNGPLHNSRSGLGVYYRYKPRNIALLCNDAETGVFIEKPKIHNSVFERIKGRSLPYAPSGIPGSYDVVTTNGKATKYENEAQAERRAIALEPVQDLIFWRRGLYIALLMLTLALLSSRFFLEWQPGGACVYSACLIDPIMLWLIDKTPEFTSGWFEALRQNPVWLWSFVGSFVVLLFISRKAQVETHYLATHAWSELIGKPAPAAYRETITSKLRVLWHRRLGKVARWVFAAALFLFIGYLLVEVINAIILHLQSTLG
jgi:uncharacterized protein (DUF2235 family)